MAGPIATLTVNALEVQTDKGGDLVAVRMGQDEKYVDLIFPRAGLSRVLDMIRDMARAEDEGTIDSGLLGPENQLSVTGRDVSRLPDGNVRLTVHLRTDDGIRSMPWPLTPDEARALASELTRYADDLPA